MYTRRIFLTVLLIVLIGITIAVLYIFYKPHRNPATESAIFVDAITLFRAYTNNETEANKKYLDKTLQVSGEFAEYKKNLDGKPVVILKTGDPVFGIICTMKEDLAEPAKGSSLIVKGICSGFSSDVVLKDCVIP